MEENKKVVILTSDETVSDIISDLGEDPTELPEDTHVNPLKTAMNKKTIQNNLKKNTPKPNFKGINLGRNHTIRPRSR